MITQKEVYKIAHEKLASMELDASLKLSIKQGDRLRNMIISLTNELNKATKIVANRRKVIVKQSTIESTIKDFVAQLVHATIVEGDQSVESQAAKTLREEKDQEIQDMENTLEGNPTGIYEELGVEIVTDREEESDL